jgi:hypothetical protein
MFANLICLSVISADNGTVIDAGHTAFKGFFADETVIAVSSYITDS